jgi:hypothetical protein
MGLKNIILSEVRLRRPKIACFPSYVDYRSKNKCSNIIGHGSHTKRRMCMEGKCKETENLNVVDMLIVQK